MPVFDLEIDDRIYIGDNIVITLTDVRDGELDYQVNDEGRQVERWSTPCRDSFPIWSEQ